MVARSAPRPLPARRASPVPAVAPSHPAMRVALAVVALCIGFDATFQTTDTDFWQHLVVGKAIWATHSIPRTSQWTWPTLGEPHVLPSWLFCALLWPFWLAGQMAGLQAWRWLTTLAAFAILWLAARRLGVRGFAALGMIGWCALVHRHRVFVRPETLADVLLALAVWVLATRRAGEPGRTWWLVPLAVVWANAHASYWMLLALIGIHAVAELAAGTKTRPGLAKVGAIAALACFVNPFGWRGLAEPFLYATAWRHETIFQTIGELQPVDWKFHLTTGYAVLLVAWPLLSAWRARRHGSDLAEWLTCALFSVLGLRNQRFVGVWAIVAAPYLARAASAAVAEIRWPRGLRPAWSRAALLAILVAGIRVVDWQRTDFPYGTGAAPNTYPAAACEFMAAQGVRGRGFNHFELGGYMLWRFWPERDRAPFLDVHLTGHPDDLRLAGLSQSDPAAWKALDTKYRFPWALLRRLHGSGDVSLDILEADSSYALVFLDDAAALYVRRDGPYARLADSLAYRVIRAGNVGLAGMDSVFFSFTPKRAVLRAELDRMSASSPVNSSAQSMLVQMDMIEGRWPSAREHLMAAKRVDPFIPLLHERLGIILLNQGHAREAVNELERAAAGEHSDAVGSWLQQARARAAGAPAESSARSGP